MYLPVEYGYKSQRKVDYQQRLETQFVAVIAACIAGHEETGKSACGQIHHGEGSHPGQHGRDVAYHAGLDARLELKQSPNVYS